MSYQERYETEIIPINEADKLVPKYIMVKVYKIKVAEDSEEQEKELDQTIEFHPKRYKKSKYKRPK